MDNPFNSKIYRKIGKRVGEAIKKYNLIEENDRLLLGLSGGKDSMILAHVLHHLQRKAPIKFELQTITFDPQFEEFNIEAIKSYAKDQNWQHHVETLDIAEIIEEKDFAKNPCVLCSRLRRGYLYKYAKKVNCNKLVLGQHLDDAIISFMMSYFRGQGITTMAPNVPADNDSLRIIRPLALTPEDWIFEFAQNFEFPNSSKCKYGKFVEANGDRAYFKNYLKELEKRIPDFRSNALKSMSNVQNEYLF